MVDKDQFGWYEECIQCGYNKDLRSVLAEENKIEIPRRKRRSHRNKVAQAS
jgi:hypothetical protein